MRARILSVAGVIFCCWVVAVVAAAPATIRIRSMADVTGALNVAKRAKKTLVIEFIGSKWCPYCKRLEANVLSTDIFRSAAQQRFVIAIADFPPLYERTADKVQADQGLADLMEVKARFQVPTFPTLIRFAADGKLLNKVVGHSEDSPDAYLKLLTKTG